MSGEYTPTVGEVRGVYVASGFRENLPHSHQSLAEWRAEFDRWLVRVRAEAQIEALKEARDEIEKHAARVDNRFTEHEVADAGGIGLLREYAARIAREAGIATEGESND